MTGHALAPLGLVLGRDEHNYIDTFINLWEYCRRRVVSNRYKADEEELLFGDARMFTLGYRYQLFALAQDYYAAYLRRVRIELANDFYNELVKTIRSRMRISTTYFYIHCRSIYDLARQHQGASKRELRIKVNKAARVTHYFSAVKLWKDCTSPEPTLQWLLPDASLEHRTDNDSTDNESTTAQASNGGND